MLASEMITKLQQLVEKYGDKKLWHEDNECNVYSLSDAIYDEKDDEFQIL